MKAIEDKLPTPPGLSLYEARIRAAWAQEDTADKTQLRAAIFLYRRSAGEAVGKWTDMDALYQSFRAEELALDLVAKLPKVRAAIRTEWGRQIAELSVGPNGVPTPLTELLRMRICDFLRQTVAILERLPP